jgi:hypothetical protein
MTYSNNITMQVSKILPFAKPFIAALKEAAMI